MKNILSEIWGEEMTSVRKYHIDRMLARKQSEMIAKKLELNKKTSKKK